MQVRLVGLAREQEVGPLLAELPRTARSWFSPVVQRGLAVPAARFSSPSMLRQDGAIAGALLMVEFPPAGRGSQELKPPGRRRGGLLSTQGWTWRQWLALGLCFGLGHGITQRLLKLGSADGPAGTQNFGVQPFPGQSLEALRQRHGGPVRPLRADLEAIEQDKRLAREKAESEQRRGELEARLKAEQEVKREDELNPTRLDSLDRQAGGASPPPPALETPASPPPERPAAGPSLPALPQAPPPPVPAGPP